MGEGGEGGGGTSRGRTGRGGERASGRGVCGAERGMCCAERAFTWSRTSAALAMLWSSRTAARRSAGASLSPELPPPAALPPMPPSSSRCTEAHSPPSCASACSMPQSSSITSAPKLRKDLPRGVGEAWAAWERRARRVRRARDVLAPGPAPSPATETKEEARECLEGVALRRRLVLLAQSHAALGEEPPRHRPQPVSRH